MSVYQIYFSPTNHTKEIVKTVSDVFGKSCEIDLSENTTPNYIEFSENDICIIGVPAYGGRVPAIALERMSKYQGNGAKVVIITSYGNRDYDDTLKELMDFVNERGFSCIAAISAVAEHSIMHQFATGRPNKEDKEELTQFSKKILDKIKNSTAYDELEVPGNYPYREYKGVPLKPKAGKKCTGCGLCVKRCPVGAISVKEPEKTDEKICISCMRCIDVCPNKARKLNSVLLKVASKKIAGACEKRKENELFI